MAPDGTEIAVVTADAAGLGGLALVPLGGGAAQSLVQVPTINIGGVAWAPDGSALLVIRRDRLPSQIEGVPRAWLLRRGGEFVGPIDPDGAPSLNPSWSPDGQALAYVSPSDARLVVRNLTTEETTVLGQPRGGAASWSADSQVIAFESVPSTTLSNPPQPIRVRSLDGIIDRTFGVAGEVRSAPKFWDGETVASLRRRFGDAGGGTELVFESIATGDVIRAFPLTGGADLILEWDLDPTRRKVVYAVRAANGTRTFELDLESGQRREIATAGTNPRWIP